MDFSTEVYAETANRWSFPSCCPHLEALSFLRSSPLAQAQLERAASKLQMFSPVDLFQRCVFCGPISRLASTRRVVVHSLPPPACFRYSVLLLELY
jgi:hypothetical protein